jgi:hypothetical protein
MGRHVSSPLLPPLLQVVCRFPEQALSHLLENLSSGKHASVLMLALQQRVEGKPLRALLADRTELLVSRVFVPGDHALRTATTLTQQISASSLLYTAVAVVRVVQQHDRLVVVRNPPLRSSLVKLFNYALAWNGHQDTIPACRSNEPRLLVKTLLELLEVDSAKAELLCNLLPIFASRNLMDLGFARTFFYKTITITWDVATKREVALRLLTYVEDPKQNAAVKVCFAQRRHRSRRRREQKQCPRWVLVTLLLPLLAPWLLSCLWLSCLLPSFSYGSCPPHTLAGNHGGATVLIDAGA